MIPFLREPTRVYALDGSGRLVAEITFPETAPGVYTIDHTFVDASCGTGRGRPAGARRPGADQVNGGTAAATCSYAAAWLDKHPQ